MRPSRGTDWMMPARRFGLESPAMQSDMACSRAARRWRKASAGSAARPAAERIAGRTLRNSSKDFSKLRRVAGQSAGSCSASGSGPVVSRSPGRPDQASTAASARSFLASLPMPSAKRRERSGPARPAPMPESDRHWRSSRRQRPAGSNTARVTACRRSQFRGQRRPALLPGNRRSRCGPCTCASSPALPTSMPATAVGWAGSFLRSRPSCGPGLARTLRPRARRNGTPCRGARGKSGLTVGQAHDRAPAC